MISCDFRPLMLTTKPTPHESCSLRGSYSPGPAGDPIIAPSSASVSLTWPRCPIDGQVTKADVSLRFAALQRPSRRQHVGAAQIRPVLVSVALRRSQAEAGY